MPIEPLTQQRRRQQTRDHLLAAATEVFAQRGFHGATLDEVAAVAGFSKGAVYSNFENKEDLFLSLFRDRYEREIQRLREALHRSEVPPEARLSEFVDVLRAEWSQDADLALLYQEFWLYAARNSVARDQLVEIEEEAVGLLTRLIESERERWNMGPLDRPRDVTRIIDLLFRGIGQLRVLQPDVANEAFLQTAINFVARGLEATVDHDAEG